jgi:hypothetical protein
VTVPEALSPPIFPFTSQLTVVFETPATVAVNCCGWNNCTVVVDGETEMLSVTVTEELADFVVSAALVAVTVIDAGLGTVAGALNKPEEDMVPTVLFPPAVPPTLHVTAVFELPATVAENCLVAPTARFAVPGVTVTVTVGVGAGFEFLLPQPSNDNRKADSRMLTNMPREEFITCSSLSSDLYSLEPQPGILGYSGECLGCNIGVSIVPPDVRLSETSFSVNTI